MNPKNMRPAIGYAETRGERRGRDRRRRTFPSLGASLLNPRRHSVRRSTDRRRIILLDCYEDAMLPAVVAVLVLSATDALLTLFLLNHGAREVNPVMAFFLAEGSMVFMTAKYLLTAMAVTIVVILNYVFLPFSDLKLGGLLKVFAALFAGVVAWELYLIFRYVL